ncbi:MAG: DUF721 domain-containing protein [Bacteroidales bacterium]|nr:DUF721 domain-containing protein [Bacteroidales bacterium]
MGSYKIQNRKPSPLGGILPLVIKDMHIEQQVIESFVVDAWAKVTPAPQATISCVFSLGVLQVGINSSVIRSELSFQKEGLLNSINRCLDSEELIKALRKDDSPIVTKIIFR